jgi:hypothetical protein
MIEVDPIEKVVYLDGYCIFDSTSDYKLWTLYRTYFKGISANMNCTCIAWRAVDRTLWKLQNNTEFEQQKWDTDRSYIARRYFVLLTATQAIRAVSRQMLRHSGN